MSSVAARVACFGVDLDLMHVGYILIYWPILLRTGLAYPSWSLGDSLQASSLLAVGRIPEKYPFMCVNHSIAPDLRHTSQARDLQTNLPPSV